MDAAHPSNSVRVRQPVLRRVWQHAQSRPKHEVCGILLGIWSPALAVAGSVEATNMLGATDRYLIDAATLLAADDLAHTTGQAIVGFYHSHPNALPIPSITDRQTAWPSYLYLIVTSGDKHPGAICGWFMDDMRRVRPALLAIVR